jgi:3-oxoacyl-[acyl-carrier-protein] synthase III
MVDGAKHPSGAPVVEPGSTGDKRLKAARSIALERIAYELPSTVVTNEDLELEFPEWEMNRVAEKSGVRSRHIAGDGETAFDLAVRAAGRVLDKGELGVGDLDGVVFCTQTPEYVMPSNAFLLHEALGMAKGALAFDYNLACSGYIYGLAIIQGLIEIGVANKVLLVTADTYSKLLNKGDRSTRAIFGDAAAATLIGVAEDASTSRVLDIALSSSGRDHRSFYVPAGGQRLPRSSDTGRTQTDASGNVRSQNDIQMNGFAVWKFIAREVPQQIRQVLERNQLSVIDVDLYVFHQASRMTLDSLVAGLGLPSDRVFMNLEAIGNTVSASIPIALADAERSGRLRRGDLVLLSGFGVGLSWGTLLMRY